MVKHLLSIYKALDSIPSVHTHTHTHTHTHRERERQTDRQTDRHREGGLGHVLTHRFG